MAVGAEQGKVCESRPCVTGHVKRENVMNLDISASATAVGLLEVKVAHFAREWLPG